MADLEKAIKGLECCDSVVGCVKCPYSIGGESTETCDHEMFNDVLELLKEQQPREQRSVKPIRFEKRSKVTRDKYECGACGSSEVFKEWEYCPWCGKPIDWSKDGDQ